MSFSTATVYLGQTLNSRLRSCQLRKHSVFERGLDQVVYNAELRENENSRERIIMRVSCTGILAAFVLMIAPIETVADPKPRNAKIASSDKIVRAYAGRTAPWDEGCDGGIYFGGNAQARAWCAQNSESLGAGTWSANSQGELCYELTWYWSDRNRIGSSLDERICISHVVDRVGRVWRSWPNEPEWWPMDRSGGMVRGYKFKNEVRQTRNKLGF